MTRSWSPAELDELRRLIAGGMDRTDVALTLNRTKKSVAAAVAKLGLQSRPPTQAVVWTETMDALLRDMIEAKHPLTNIAARMGISRNSVDLRRAELGLQSKQHVTRADRWPPEADPWAVKVRFDNVSADEAKRISAGAPKSAKFTRHLRHSAIGCAAALCITNGPPS